MLVLTHAHPMCPLFATVVMLKLPSRSTMSRRVLCMHYIVASRYWWILMQEIARLKRNRARAAFNRCVGMRLQAGDCYCCWVILLAAGEVGRRHSGSTPGPLFPAFAFKSAKKNRIFQDASSAPENRRERANGNYLSLCLYQLCFVLQTPSPSVR